MAELHSIIVQSAAFSAVPTVPALLMARLVMLHKKSIWTYWSFPGFNSDWSGSPTGWGVGWERRAIVAGRAAEKLHVMPDDLFPKPPSRFVLSSNLWLF